MSELARRRIAAVAAWEALDSRGRPTVACAVTLADGAAGRAIAPAGASTGGHEASELRDGGSRYGGWGVTQAVRAVRECLAPAVLGLDAADQQVVDAALEAADGTRDLGRTGSNAVLAVSLAALLAGAAQTGRPLYRVLDDGADVLLPMPMVNVISGGAHAAGAIDIQDVLVVPVGARSFAQAIEWAWRVRAATSELISARGASTALVADEGGLAAQLDSNRAAAELVTAGIDRAGLRPGTDAVVAIDVAANQLLGDDGRYHLRLEDRALDAAGLVAELAEWCAALPIASVEDPLAEDDEVGWRLASEQLGRGRQLVGDDLFATQLTRVRHGIEHRLANAVLAKPNQAGTVSRSAAVVDAAHCADLSTVVSARSGDTEDHWLADLAVGWRAGQIKVGSTTRSERTSKWNRLLEIEAREPRTTLAPFPHLAATAGRS